MSNLFELGRVRRQQVVNLSITELMILLVFMAITYSFLAREEDRKPIPYSEKLLQELKDANERLQSEIKKLQQQRDDALARIAELERRLRQLFPDNSSPVPNPPNDSFTAVLKSVLSELQTRAAQADRLQARVAELEKENQELREKLPKQSGGKAPGLPRCGLTKGFLLALTAKSDGSFVGVPAWDDRVRADAAVLPGIAALSSGKPISQQVFTRGATELSNWGRRQEEPCMFSVRFRHETSDIRQLGRQLAIVEQFFYTRWDR